jgi:hypothetical protein
MICCTHEVTIPGDAMKNGQFRMKMSMTPKLTRLFLLLLSLQIVLPTQVVLADTGPKPTMEFEFKQELPGEPVTIISGILYECEQPDCSDATPLKELGPQRFTCDENSCSGLAYGFSTYHRIEIEFSDGQTRLSNIFVTAGFDSNYKVTVRPDDLLVESQFNLLPPAVSPGGAPRSILIVLVCVCSLLGMLLAIGVVIFLVLRSRKK